MNMFRDRLALVTGAAQGMGRLIAIKLAQLGCRVIVLDLDAEGAKKVAQEIRDLEGEAWHFAVDITDIEAVQRFHRRVNLEIGRVDLLVNNAGVVFGGAFESVPLDKHMQIFQVNMLGLMTLTHTFFGDLLSGKDTHLVNIASAAGYIGLPFGSTYAASKWAVVGFSDSIRLELAERGLDHVSVTTVCPSFVNTGAFDGVRPPRFIPFLEPEFVADKIIEAIAHNEAVVREPFMVKAIGFLKLLPLRWSDWATQKLGVTSSLMRWK